MRAANKLRMSAQRCRMIRYVRDGGSIPECPHFAHQPTDFAHQPTHMQVVVEMAAEEAAQEKAELSRGLPISAKLPSGPRVLPTDDRGPLKMEQ